MFKVQTIGDFPCQTGATLRKAKAACREYLRSFGSPKGSVRCLTFKGEEYLGSCEIRY
jgi:hypothetical protein